MDDLRDPQQAEELAAFAPDEYLRRREFLERMGVIAGVGAAAASVLGAEELVRAAGRAQAEASPTPTPQNMPVDTIVVLMMENRSFDHYLGWLPGADGRQHMTFRDLKGKVHKTKKTIDIVPNYMGCAFNDPDHGWDDGRRQFAKGTNKGFLQSTNNDDFAISYYRDGDIPFSPFAAKQTTVYDRYFCSLMASTQVNRQYMWAATSYGRRSNGEKNRAIPGTTIFDSLDKAGVSNRYFYTDIPLSALWGIGALKRSGRMTEYYERCANGTLPRVCFVDPGFNTGQDGTSTDEHPFGDVRVGQSLISDVVHAFMESPHWKSGALFLTYDEWGGFFDHVPPPRVPDDRSNKKLKDDFGQMGFRVPAMAFSPYLRRGHVDHGIYGHESILKMIEQRWGLNPLTKRDKFANSIANSFDWESPPRLDPLDLPHPHEVLRKKCVAPKGKKKDTGTSPGTGIKSPKATSAEYRPSEHGLNEELVTSGVLAKLGFKYRDARPEDVFRHPTKATEARLSGMDYEDD